MIKFSKKTLLYLSIGYVYIPIALFLFGWCKLWIALACCAALTFSVRRMLSDYLSAPADSGDDGVSMKLSVFVFAALFLLLIGYYAGWGRWVRQTSDWHKHNLILMDLVNRSWPIYYANGNEHSMLSYYIAQYLVPAFFGKILHSVRMAEIINYVWSEIGLFLVYFNFLRVVKIKRSYIQVISAVLLIFFCLPELLANIFRWLAYPETGGIGWLSPGQFFSSLTLTINTPLQYSANFILLHWVFPQALVPWLSVLFFWENRTKMRHYMTLFLPLTLFATLPFIGVVPLAVGCAIEVLIVEKDLPKWLKEAFSIENLLTFTTVGITFFLYLYGNAATPKPHDLSFQLLSYGNYKLLYFIFAGVQVIPYAALLYRDNRKNAAFYAALLTLLILPFFKMGFFNDLVMRCSIPSLFLLLIFSAQYLNLHLGKYSSSELWEKLSGEYMRDCIKHARTILLCALLMIGAWYPLLELEEYILSDNPFELGNELEFGIDSYGTMETYANRDYEVTESGYESMLYVMKYNYFAYDIEENWFYRYVARTTFPDDQ